MTRKCQREHGDEQGEGDAGKEAGTHDPTNGSPTPRLSGYRTFARCRRLALVADASIDAELGPAGGRPASLARVLLVGCFVVVALVFFGYALVDAWRETDGQLPSAVRLGSASATWLVGLACGGFAWSELLGGPRLRLGAGLVVSQLGKYAPGGIVQAGGQVAHARSQGVPLDRASAAFVVLALVQAIAGCSWCIVLAVSWTDAAWWLRAGLAGAAIATLSVLDRRWMVWLLGRFARTRSGAGALVPPQSAIIRAWAASLGSLGAASLSYVLLLGALGPVDRPWFVLSGYAAAWTVGFLVIPIPSGLGVREGLLASILAGQMVPSVLVAASLYHRLVLIVTEGVAALLMLLLVRSTAGPQD